MAPPLYYPGDNWTCLGPGPAHVVDLQSVERLGQWDAGLLTITRCVQCQQHYQFSADGTMSWTYVWIPLDPDEVELQRAHINYRPRSAVFHRWDGH